MKKVFSYSVLCAAALIAIACSENKITPEVSSDTRVMMEFTAGFAQTKTSIDGQDVLWSDKDAISVFDGTRNNRFELSEGGGTPSATFTGSAEEVSEYVALYPYSALATYSPNTVSSVLPLEQYSTADATFDTMLNPAVTKTGGSVMTFRNIAGIIRINVTGIPDGLGIREIQASAATSLTGSYTVDTSGDDFEAVSSEPDAANGVRLTAMDGGSLAAGAYNLVVLPGTYSELKVTVILTDGSYVAKGGADNAKEAVIPANGGINISIDASNPTKVSNGLVNYFKNGEDLYIGGKIYNKSQFADDGIVDYSGTTSSIYNTSTYGDGKIIFVRPDAVVKNLGNANNIVVVGTDPQDRSLVNKTSCNNLFTAQDVNRLILANIRLDASAVTSGNALFTANGGTFDELVFDNCEIILPAETYLVSIPANTAINRIVITGCDITVPQSSKNRYIVHTGTAETTVQEAVFTNNVFHCGADNASISNFRVFSGNTFSGETVTNATTINSLVFENNTLVNLDYQNSGLLVANDIGSASIRNNLVYIDQENTSKNARNLLIATASYPAKADCRDNIVYDTNISDGAPAFNMFYHSQYNGVLGISPTVLATSPLAVENYDECRFTPVPEYASYGAQR